MQAIGLVKLKGFNICTTNNDLLVELLQFKRVSATSKHESPTASHVNRFIRAKVTRTRAFLAVYPLKTNTLALYFASFARYAAPPGKRKVPTSPEAEEAENQAKRVSSRIRLDSMSVP